MFQTTFGYVHPKAVATIGLALYLAELSRYSAFLETSL